MPLEREDSTASDPYYSDTAALACPRPVSAPDTLVSLGLAAATPLASTPAAPLGPVASDLRRRRGYSTCPSIDLRRPWLSDDSLQDRLGPPFSIDSIDHSTVYSASRPKRSDPTAAATAAPSVLRFDATGKRSSIQAKDHAIESVPVKRSRTGALPLARIEMRSGPSASVASSVEEAVSPLFFSHHPTRHFFRPASVPVSEAATAMLPSPHEEAGGSVTTLKLPRANVNSIPPAMSGSTPGSLQSSADITATPSLRHDACGMQLGLQIFQDLGLLEFLENDERPTFLVDLAACDDASRLDMPIVYRNTSLRDTQHLHSLFSFKQDNPVRSGEFGDFRRWVFSSGNPAHNADSPPSTSHEYGGITWVSTTLRRRFRFISGSVAHRSARTASLLSPGSEMVAADFHGDDDDSRVLGLSSTAEMVDPPDYFGDFSIKQHLEAVSGAGSVDPDHEANRCHPDDFTNQVLQSLPAKASYDWTTIPMSDDLPEHIKCVKTVDWASTPLGPIDEWNSHLRSAANLVMSTPHPAVIYWGDELICIYNAAFVELAGQKHPDILGKTCIECWGEIWDDVGPTMMRALNAGQASMHHDQQLLVNRNGYLEEGFFSWANIPLLGSYGEVVGLYLPCFENTRRKIGERRMLTLREIGEQVATATSVSQFWPQTQKGLEYNEYDVPFSLIYSVKDEVESEASSLHSSSSPHSHQLVLESSPDVPEGHAAVPLVLDLRTSDEGFAPYMRQSLSQGGIPVVLSQEDGGLPPALIQGFQWRGFGDPCRTIVIFPVIPTTTAEAVTGFIILGVNPRRPYDDDYRLFIHLLSRQLDTSMASVVLFEEEIRRGRAAAQLAALDRQELSKQLWQRTQEANDLGYKLKRMAEFAPVGMFIADGQGRINYCNDMWWRISNHSRCEAVGDSWMDSVRVQDRPRLEAAWRSLVEDRVTISVEFRFNCSQQYGSNTIDTWVLMSAFPEKHPDGSLMSVFGCITDISSQKWAEKVQNERREEAVEHKRQQENFIDITSHEMRNPLSAILQCVDQIADSISTFTAYDDKVEVDMLLGSCLDAVNTINLCASHQKRIVDDVLTLSKLDSNLLSVNPVDEQPIRVIVGTLKMFEAELVAHDIDLEFRIDESFERYGAKWVRLDPTRLRQVMINLMTNAIKFTQGRDKRAITVSMYVTRDISEDASRNVRYLDRNKNQRAPSMDIDNHKEWGKGEIINVHCSVEDTGPGLGEQELKLLFQRFQQVTPRTHVQYGGSGLGLFISRILTEMQGGQIGVSSQKDAGSYFSFYIRGRRCLNPPAEHEDVKPFKMKRKAQPPTLTSMRTTTTMLATATALSLPPLGPMRSPRLHTRRQPDSVGVTLFDVLIVEDNIVNQRVLQRQLRNCGNTTFVANHGREALETLQRSSFWLGQETQGVEISVVLMDLEMPVMDGMTCTRRIRELQRQGTIVRHIPIIAVTAYARPEQIANAKAAGIDDVISKPFRIPELMPKIEELVGKYRNLAVSVST